MTVVDLIMVAGWLASAVLASVALGQRLSAVQIRRSIRRHLHEARRPLQALALAGPPEIAASCLDLTAAALSDLEREMKRAWWQARSRGRGSAECRGVIEAAAGRWRRAAEARGGGIRISAEVAECLVSADRIALSQALDNLIVNALEHGGARLTLSARATGGSVRFKVVDDGQLASVGGSAAPGPVISTPVLDPVVAIPGPAAERGNGLRVVRDLAAVCGGRFALQCSPQGSEAILELPVGHSDPTVLDLGA